MQPKCIINPKTKKSYTRHNYEQKDLRVDTYVSNGYGGYAPYSYSFNLVCIRCGFKQHCTY